MAVIVNATPIITSADLASYLREPNPDSAAISLYVELANGIVTEAFPGSVPSTAPTRLKAITLEVAARAYRNPNGYSSETVDDYTYRRDTDTRAAGVYLTDGERAELTTISGGGIRRAGTIPMTSPLDIP